MDIKIGLFNESFPPLIDGVSNCVYNYAKYITKNHGRCTVVTPKYPFVVDDYPFDVYRHSSFDVSKRLGYRVGNALSLKTIHDLKAQKFDLIHVHSPFTSMIIANELAKLKPKTPVVFTYHTKFDIDILKKVKFKMISRSIIKIMMAGIKKADEVWVVSKGAAESLRNLGYKGDYKVMPNGTDFPKGKADWSDVCKLKENLSINNEFVFLFVGRLMWYKNIELIIDALKQIGNDIDYKMVFVGDGSDRPAMEIYAKRVGILDRCVFAGAVYDREKLRVYFSMSDLFLFPSTYDTSGLVVKEAAACKVPSILVRDSCAAEEVEDGFSGFLCDENIDSLEQKIRQATADKEKMKSIGENALNHVYKSWEDAVDLAYKRYEKIVLGWEKPLPYKDLKNNKTTK